MRNTISLILLLGCIMAFGQNHRYGRVSKAELEKKESTINPDAAAEILYEKAYLSLEYNPTQGTFILTKEYEGRVKIYDKDNVDDKFLTQEVSIYSPSSDRDRLLTFRGSTYNLENGKVVETKVRNADIFKEKESKYWDKEKFTYPNVQNGSVLEYRYTITTPHFRDLGRWYFQQEIPVLYSEFKFKRPEFFTYSPDMRGEIVGRSKNSSYPAPNLGFDYTETEYIYTNVPALAKEPYVFNLNNLKASLRLELMMFSHPGVISQDFSTSWEQIGKDLMKHRNFGEELKGNNFLNETVENISGNASTPEEKNGSYI